MEQVRHHMRAAVSCSRLSGWESALTFSDTHSGFFSPFQVQFALIIMSQTFTDQAKQMLLSTPFSVYKNNCLY